MNLSIEKIDNGIFLSARYEGTLIKKYDRNIEDLFNQLLLELEGKSICFGGDSYGCVHVFYKPEETFTSPPEENPV
jgi:hypothetical protein